MQRGLNGRSIVLSELASKGQLACTGQNYAPLYAYVDQ